MRLAVQTIAVALMAATPYSQMKFGTIDAGFVFCPSGAPSLCEPGDIGRCVRALMAGDVGKGPEGASLAAPTEAQPASAYDALSNTYARDGRFELALAAAAKAISIRPLDANLWYNRANVYLMQRRFGEAVQDYTRYRPQTGLCISFDE